MKRALAISLSLAAAACEDPAALEVIVQIQEEDLADLALRIHRGRDESGPQIVDCALPQAADPEGTCPFEKGAGRWIDPARYPFILYGEPATEVAIWIDGRREFTDPRTGEERLAVVTTTAATVSLPPNPGERNVLTLPLIDRTSERFRCPSVAVAEAVDFTGQSSLVIIGAGEHFAYTAVANELARVRHVREGEGCALEPESLGRLPCRVRPRSLVGRATADGSVVMLAGVCANQIGGTGTTTLLSVITGPQAILTSTLTVPVGPARVTQPVLANLDASDGAPEVVFIHSRSRTNVMLGIWKPFVGTATVALAGVQVTVEPGETLPGPIVVRGRTTEPILVAGYGGTAGMVWASRTGPVFTPLPMPDDDAPSRRGPALALLSPPVLVDVRAEVVRFTQIRMPANGPPELIDSWTSSISATPNRDLGVRVAVARVGDDEALHAVFTEQGVVHLHPFDGSGGSSFDAWGGRIDGAQQTLLWNLDGRPGAEIITYANGDDTLYAATSGGRLLDDWRPLMASQIADSMTVALAKLEGPADVDLDVVVLSGKHLEVITLGANSAPPREFSWPMPNHDSAGTGTWVEGVREPMIEPPR